MFISYQFRPTVWYWVLNIYLFFIIVVGLMNHRIILECCNKPMTTYIWLFLQRHICKWLDLKSYRVLSNVITSTYVSNLFLWPGHLQKNWQDWILFAALLNEFSSKRTHSQLLSNCTHFQPSPDLCLVLYIINTVWAQSVNRQKITHCRDGLQKACCGGLLDFSGGKWLKYYFEYLWNIVYNTSYFWNMKYYVQY